MAYAQQLNHLRTQALQRSSTMNYAKCWQMLPDTVTRDPKATQATVHAVGDLLQMDTKQARALRLHATATYLLPREQVVVKLTSATQENLSRAAVALRVTAWLADVGFPAVRPNHRDPVQVNGFVATLWHYLPQPEQNGSKPMTALGRLLRDLHSLPDPPFTLPLFEPLARL